MNSNLETQKNLKGNHDSDPHEYIEVLGDTVYGKHMIITIVVSVFLGLGGFLLGKEIFPNIAPENMVSSYSLLLGIAGLVIALIVNSFLFKPKRRLVEEESSVEKIHEIFHDYQLDLDEERKEIKNNPVVEKEMKEQGIYNMFFPEKEENK
ncbi:hypothetical protein AM500_03585 [Bacillus sp. FJAT-18017]|uniref:hypothetical protein n=1 Tax=Bacillus sp. FJAT-18017 TaxID=1705566 RepID=UPI0006ADA1D5|nr:hypothetical protein [Bacillus sp. FJAT-18017]ALC88980.1 hypothetical protein AM500_03585 [Bacillus sp. FJAT-18017]